MQTLKIKFVDFWRDFNSPKNNYFFEVLSEKYNVVFSDEPDILFYSCYSSEYLKYNCTKIYYTAENLRPDFTGCDYALSFDYISNQNHFRLPVWVLDHKFYREECAYPSLQLVPTKEEATEIWNKKTKFCCIFVSNPNAPERIEFFNRLNKIQKVDSAGKWNNTIGYYLTAKANEKVEFIKDYKFVISFENSSHCGYTTEKIIDPFFADSIPIYWGDVCVGKDFNTKRFINVNQYKNFDEAINEIIKISETQHLAAAILSEPVFTDNQLPVCASKDALLQKLTEWVEEARSKNFSGVATTYKKHLHKVNLKKKRVEQFFKFKFKKYLSR